MKSKKLATIFLIFTMAISLMSGCGASNGKQSDSDNENQKLSLNKTETDSGNNMDAIDNTPTEKGKTLVVYYSASGNTKDVAEKIAKITGGTLFKIEPIKTYTEEDLDWTNDNSRVSKEYDDERLRNVELISTRVENWDSYDNVYIGYPIWWGIAAWPINNFVKENDFTGKTVIPFCTSASSGIGDSDNLLEEMTGTGKWKEGERFYGGSSESEISSWIESMKV